MTQAGILKACSVGCEDLCKLSDAIIKGASSVALVGQTCGLIPGGTISLLLEEDLSRCATSRSQQTGLLLNALLLEWLSICTGQVRPLEPTALVPVFCYNKSCHLVNLREKIRHV